MTELRTTPFDQYFLGIDFFATHLSSIYGGCAGGFTLGVQKSPKKQDRYWKVIQGLIDLVGNDQFYDSPRLVPLA